MASINPSTHATRRQALSSRSRTSSDHEPNGSATSFGVVALLVSLPVLVVIACQSAQQIPPHEPHPPAATLATVVSQDSVLQIPVVVNLSKLGPLLDGAAPSTVEGIADWKGDGGDLKGHIRYKFDNVRALTEQLQTNRFGAIASEALKSGLETPDQGAVSGLTVLQNRIVYWQTYSGEVETIDNNVITDPGCHLKPMYPQLTLTARPGFEQQGDTFYWGILDGGAAITFRRGTDFNCAFFNKNISQLINDRINSVQFLVAIRDRLKTFRREIPVADVWSKLAGPASVSISASRGNVCIYPGVREIGVSKLEGDQQATRFSLTLRAKPAVTIEETCQKGTVVPVQLATEAVDITEDAPSTVVLPMAIAYGELTAQAAKVAAGRTIDALGFRIEIKSVRIEETSGQLVASIDVAGGLNGTIYFWGTPTMMLGGTMLGVDDLHLAAETSDILDRIKVGLASAIAKDALVSSLTNALRIDLGPRISIVSEKLNGTHQFGAVSLQVEGAHLRGTGIFAREDALVAEATLDASIKASLDASLADQLKF